MRPTTHLPLPRLIPSIRPISERRRTDQKPAIEAKPAKKRSLNEAAHKLGH